MYSARCFALLFKVDAILLSPSFLITALSCYGQAALPGQRRSPLRGTRRGGRRSRDTALGASDQTVAVDATTVETHSGGNLSNKYK